MHCDYFIIALFFQGLTPQRRQFSYPTKLVKTEPHNVLKKRFQASHIVPYSPEPHPIKVQYFSIHTITDS